MATVVYEEVERATEKELEAAVQNFPMYASKHEAYAVLKEEVEELQDAVNEVNTMLEYLWKKVKENEDVEDNLVYIVNAAQHAAVEAIQVAAVAVKAELSEKDEELDLENL